MWKAGIELHMLAYLVVHVQSQSSPRVFASVVSWQESYNLSLRVSLLFYCTPTSEMGILIYVTDYISASESRTLLN